jgi:hypothetical protein
MNNYDRMNKIKSIIRDDKEKRDLMKNNWVLLDKYEYKLSSAFGGERINVLWRKPCEKSVTYNILYAGDVDDFM